MRFKFVWWWAVKSSQPRSSSGSELQEDLCVCGGASDMDSLWQVMVIACPSPSDEQFEACTDSDLARF